MDRWEPNTGPGRKREAEEYKQLCDERRIGEYEIRSERYREHQRIYSDSAVQRSIDVSARTGYESYKRHV